MSWQDRWKQSRTLDAGAVLYHGTSVDFHGSQIRAPVWLSDAENVARWFALRFGDAGRVLSYELTEAVELPAFSGKGQMQEFAETFRVDIRGAETMRETIGPAPVPGWIIPDNYQTGADILLSDVTMLQYKDEAPVSNE